MNELKLHGKYSHVLKGMVEDNDIKVLNFGENIWGIGLGAPGISPDSKNNMGEAIFLSGSNLFLTTGKGPKAAQGEGEFTSGFFCSWDTKDAIAYYSAPGSGWSISVLLGQIYSELTYSNDSSGLYGVVMSGKFSDVDCQSLSTSPIFANKPENGKRINASSNYNDYFRKLTGAYKNAPFVSAGIMFIPDELSLLSGSEHVEELVGPLHNRGDFHYHMHSIVFNPKTGVLAEGAQSVKDIEDFAKGNLDNVVSVEHLLPTTEVFEAKCFLTPFNKIIR